MSTGVPGFFGLKAESNFPPVISSVTLTELSPGDGTLFGNQSFSVEVVMTNEGKPVAGKALKGYIDGTFNEPVLTDSISSVQKGATLQGVTFYAVDASETAFDGEVGSPTTSNFVSVAVFQETYNVGISYARQDHFLAVTDDNKLAYSPNGVQWEVRSDAGITNAVFRKVQPLYRADRPSPSGPPAFVACGQISGGPFYFLATCDDNATFVVDKYFTEEILFLTGTGTLDQPQTGGSWAGTATKLYYRRDLQSEWELIDSGNGPYQYQDGEQYVRNGNFVIDTVSPYTALTGLTGGFDDFYRLSSSSGSSRYGLAGSGGTIFVEALSSSPPESWRFNYNSTAITGAANYYALPASDDAPWWSNIITYVTISGGIITAHNTAQTTIDSTYSINNNATLTYARDVAYSDTNKLGVFVGDGGQIIFAVHETSEVTFSSDLNFSLINEYDTLSLVIGNTEYPEYRFFVLDKSSSSMTLLGESGVLYNGRRLRGGSLTTEATRRYLQMINYAGAYNNVESLVDSDPGFTDQQTTGNEIQDIRFPATYADQSGFINRFEDVVEPGATLTIELKAFNAYGSDTDSDTVTPS